MGLTQTVNPSTDFVLELLKNMDRDGMEQIARYVVNRLDEKPVIDIPSPNLNTSRIQQSFEPNQLFQLLLSSNLLANNSVGSLFDLFKNKQNTNSNSVPEGDDYSDGDNLLANTESLFSPSSLFGPLISSFLPQIIAIGSDLLSPKSRTRDEMLLEAMIPYLPKAQQQTFRTLAPAIRILGILQSNGFIGKNLLPKGLFSKGIFSRKSSSGESKDSDTGPTFFPKISRKAIAKKLKHKLKINPTKHK